MLEPLMDRRRSRGFSMLELLVGSAIGLLVAAAAGSVVAAHYGEARRLQSEARLTQDLRGTVELVERDLRRAGYWSSAASAVRLDDAAVLVNPHLAIAAVGDPADAVALSFSTDSSGAATTVDDSERFGFRLRAGALEVQLGAANWQALNDVGTLVVTTFRVEPRIDEASLAGFCEQACAVGSTACPPRHQVRSFVVTLAGRSPVDPRLTRSLRSVVRTRNDTVVGSCEG
jgi:prepilin peptidase dependent protein B